MSRQLYSFFISFLMLICSSCTSQKEQEKQSLSAKVLCTTQLIADTVKKITSDTLQIEVLIHGEIDPHSYQLVKGDLEKICEAKILFANGLNLEHGRSLKSAIDEHAHPVKLGDYIYAQDSNLILIKDHELDPHIWMDVALWKKTIRPIVEALIQEFPEYKSIYLQNAQKLEQQWDEFDLELFYKLQSIPKEKRYLVTSHDAFNYFSRRYLATEEERLSNTWTDRFKAPEGLSPDGQIGPYDIKKILDHLKKYQIQVVFPESNVSLDSLKKIRSIAKSQDLKVIFAKEPLFGDSMSGDDISVSNYEEMMKHNVEVITSYWNQYE